MRESIRKVLNYIEDHLGERLSSNRLATIACLSPSRFHRVFRQDIGDTPQKFIERLRLAKAYSQVTSGEGAVQDLAISLGYNDYETFSRAFKRQYHFAPQDLKLIAQKTKSTISGPSQLFVITSEEMDPEEIKKKIRQRLEEEGVDLGDINQGAAVMVQPITVEGLDMAQGEVIHNKYHMSSGERFWKQLVADLKKPKPE